MRGDGRWIAAKNRGDMFYSGRPCIRCKATLRYVKNRCCVHCNKIEHSHTPSKILTAGFPTRAKALEKGYTRYYGRTCRVCGGTQRYIANGNCAVCHYEKRTDREEKRTGFISELGALRLTEVQNQQFKMALWNEARRSCKSSGRVLTFSPLL